MMDEADFDLLLQSLLEVITINKRLGSRSGGVPAASCFEVPLSTSAQQWRDLIDRLNAVDPEGGWGRAVILGRECIVTKGEWIVRTDA